jgi:hypothetical protein
VNIDHSLFSTSSGVVMNINPDISNLTFLRRPGSDRLLSKNSPLVNYALSGLQRCWMPEHGRWSHIYHLDGRDHPNESVPPSDVFYTLNVLLGMSRLNEIPSDINVSEIFRRNVGQLARMPVAKYAFGMALWAAAELDLDLPEDVLGDLNRVLAEKNWKNFRAQDLGMLLTGIVAQARAGRKQWVHLVDPLFSFLSERYHSESGLFFDTASGLRRRFASFATQTYLTIACYHYGEFRRNPVAVAMANACARKLIALQGPQGEWPWFFDAQQGRVLDFYEVYSVHQYGMAPAWLECAERHDVREARAALIKGFKWMFGENQLGKSMLIPELQLSIRSQVRKGELQSKGRRVLRAVGNASLRHSSGLIDPGKVGLRLECRSYELGWILWSFGKRTDLSQLAHHEVFCRALK